MKPIRYLVLAVLAVALAGTLALEAAEENKAEPKPEETLGQKVDRAVEQLRQEAHQWGEDLREGVEQMQARVERMGVAARVYARLHWDKTLTAAPLSVDLEQGGVAVLTGTVPNAEAKTKAEHLAQETVGVQRVTNNLQVQAPPAKGP